MLTPFFSKGPVRNWSEAAQCDTAAFGRMHAALIQEGLYWPPSQFEAGFMSLAHDENVLKQSERAIDAAFKRI
jgi:glutamate-1-semialdehyde 2,1-aminomutase